jgi:hypothetical protein
MLFPLLFNVGGAVPAAILALPPSSMWEARSVAAIFLTKLTVIWSAAA